MAFPVLTWPVSCHLESDGDACRLPVKPAWPGGIDSAG